MHINSQIKSFIFNQSQRILFGVIMAALAAYFSVMAFRADGVLEWGDGIVHYNIARYAPQKPELFLDHWGKPVFTLLSSPFAQMGFPGMIVFNVILFCITSVLIFLWAEKRKNPFAWITPILLCSSVVYFDMVNAGMTEILFATILVLTVYFFLDKKYILGSVIFSFSLFSRPEGNIILPIFLLFLLYKKQWKAIPFLGVGFLLYSMVGYFHYHDFLWFFTQNPYSPISFYGHGELLHFVMHAHSIWGTVLIVLCVGSALWLFGALFTEYRTKAIDYFFLVLIPATVVFAVHSYIWWKGLHGSGGLTRVIATVIPLYVMLGLLFLNGLKNKISLIAPTSFSPVIFLLLSVCLGYFTYRSISRFSILPIKESEAQVVLSEAAKWYREQKTDADKVTYYDHYFAFKADINPYDYDKVFPVHFLQTTSPPPGTWMIWDSKFGGQDGRLPKEKLLGDSTLQIMKTFTAKNTTFAADGRPFEVIIARVK